MRQIILKRVPLGLDWAIGRIWFGYTLPENLCECCVGIGQVNWPMDHMPIHQSDENAKYICPVCKGKGKVAPIVEVPSGKGYQIWETQNYFTGENEHFFYPVSPVKQDAFSLAEWMSVNFVIGNDQLNSESIWYDALEDDNVDVVFGLHKTNMVIYIPKYY